ncbi:terminase small subunit protein [Rhizobium phage RHph_I1_18]|nr:terminase small subunit protein [Rhizobium phage RHph_I1_18]
MTDESNSVSLNVVASNGQLIDPNISKREDIENDLAEVVESLRDREKDIDKALGELVQLAMASQNPDFYKALALLIQASAKNTREITLATKMKADQIDKLAGPSEPSVVQNTTNNTLVMTTTDMLDRLRGES